MLWASRNGDKQRRTDGNRTRDAQEQRSGRWMAMVGVAARKQAEMDLWVQRRGWERAVVGFAERGQAETDGREQD